MWRRSKLYDHNPEIITDRKTICHLALRLSLPNKNKYMQWKKLTKKQYYSVRGGYSVIPIAERILIQHRISLGKQIDAGFLTQDAGNFLSRCRPPSLSGSPAMPQICGRRRLCPWCWIRSLALPIAARTRELAAVAKPSR